ncbi:MAG: Hsp20/alpha crystallin family protein [Candidatus Helarchaeales archaeon]
MSRDLVRYSPFQSIIDRFFSDWDDWLSWPKMEFPEIRTPLMDIKEDKDKYILKMDLPGIDKKDVKIEIEKDRIFEIRAEYKTEEEEKDEGYLRRERSQRSYFRRFMLPQEVEADKVQAKLENGVLTVTIPKKAPVEEPKKVVEIK